MTAFNYPSSILCIKTLNIALAESRFIIFLYLFKKILTTDNDKFDDYVSSKI